VDLNIPTLVPAITRALGLSDEQGRQMRAALDRKDAGAIAAFGNGASDLLARLIGLAGPADSALGALKALTLPPEAASACAQLEETVALLRTINPDIRLTVDPVENRGFEYHTGVSFVLFALGARGELGRGGRYLAGGPGVPNGAEPATGFTLFMDTVIGALPEARMPERVFVPLEAGIAAIAKLQGEGWITVAGLEPVKDATAEAARLGCTHVFTGGKAVAVKSA
jgi:ATP phosphoribosyltransferase regulatory subunit